MKIWEKGAPGRRHTGLKRPMAGAGMARSRAEGLVGQEGGNEGLDTTVLRAS